MRSKFISIFLDLPPQIIREWLGKFEISCSLFPNPAEISEISQKKVQSPGNFEVGNLLRKHPTLSQFPEKSPVVTLPDNLIFTCTAGIIFFRVGECQIYIFTEVCFYVLIFAHTDFIFSSPLTWISSFIFFQVYGIIWDPQTYCSDSDILNSMSCHNIRLNKNVAFLTCA